MQNLLALTSTNKDQKYLITSVNELRNALDHIMRAVNNPESLEINFEKTKGHLYRAGYDAYEILAVSKLNEIIDIKKQFSYNAIIEGYPKYHNDVIPMINKAKNELAYGRANKKIDTDLGIDADKEKKHFNEFELIVKSLTSLVDDIINHIGGIKEAQDNHRRRNIKNIILISLLCPFTVGIVIWLINLLFNCNK